MAKHLSITTGDPADPTNTFTALIFISKINDAPVHKDGETGFAEVFLSIYRNSNALGTLAIGDPVGLPIRITAGSSTQTDGSGNDIQVLYSSWLDATGNIDFENVYSNLQTLTVRWSSNGESMDLSTATLLP